jgi:colanic acid biosynthesis glycosyl transferase WcaI
VRPLKILFVLGFPNPSIGADWTRIGFFADAWSKKGHSIEILGAFSYKSLQKRGIKRLSEANAFNLIYNMNLTHPSIFTLNSIISFLISTLFLTARKPNVVIVSVPSGDVGLGALIACKLVRVKSMVDYRDEWENYTINLENSRLKKSFYSTVKKLLVSIYAKSQLITAVTPNFVDSLKSMGIVNARLLPNGADIKTFKPLSIKKEKQSFTIFYSGTIGGYYRLDVAIKSLKKLVDIGIGNVKLVIAGGGEVQKIFKLADDLGVLNNIEYKGTTNDKKKLAHLIAKADVGLIPYDANPLWKNSLPAKFFEYCACGIPVIATAHEDSLLNHWIRKYRIGITSPPMDEKKLAEAVYRIYQSKSFREEAGKRARVLIEEKFDRNKIAEQFLQLIEATCTLK